MKNLKLELFNFKKDLTMDQEDILRVVEAHMDYISEYSEKAVISSLNDRLNIYKYDKSVKSLLENLNTDVIDHELLYELKDLYKIIEKKNQGMIYRQPLNVILQTINLEADSDRMDKILNELAIYDWVPEIKFFMYKLTKSPEQKNNIISSGKTEPVYTIAEAVENGHIVFIKDSWFLMSEDGIEKTLLETHVKDIEKLNKLRLLQTSLQVATIDENKITFKIDENLSLGVSVKTQGEIFINDEKVNKETTLESIFESPIVPVVQKNFYPLISEVSKNIDSFVELDVVRKVTNLVNLYTEMYVFNYKDSLYVYRCDKRYSNTMFKYESAVELVKDILNEMNCDVTFFYEKGLNKERKVSKELEDKEVLVKAQLEEINVNIDKLEANILVCESEILSAALVDLKTQKKDVETELVAIKELKYKEATIA
jgi:hypothetical protein